MVNVGITQ